MSRKIISGLLTATLLLSLPLGAMASPAPEIYIDGQWLPTSQPPVVQDGRTLVPFRAIAEGLGATVHYDAAAKRITAEKGDTTIVFTLQAPIMTVNGEEKLLEVPPQLINDFTMLPARAFAEALGATVTWENGQIFITTAATVPETVLELPDPVLGQVKLKKHCLGEEVKSWSITVNGREIASVPEDGAYYHGSLEIEDLTGDGYPEILFFRYSTGTAGAMGLTVFSLQGEKFGPIFADRNWQDEEGEFRVNYQGGSVAHFYHRPTGLYTLIPIPQTDELHADLLPAITTWVDPVIRYEFPASPTGRARDIVSERRVIGVAHAHTLATLKTTYRWSDGRYEPVQIALFDTGNQLLAEGYYRFTGAPSYLDERSVVVLAAEAVSRVWHVLGGGNRSGEYETFTLDGMTYRYLGEDLATGEKLVSYLSEVFTEEAIAEILATYGIIEHEGRMAQPEAGGGSLLEWDKAQATLIDEGEDWKQYELKVPYPVGDDVEFEVRQVEVKRAEKGWLLATPVL